MGRILSQSLNLSHITEYHLIFQCVLSVQQLVMVHTDPLVSRIAPVSTVKTGLVIGRQGNAHRLVNLCHNSDTMLFRHMRAPKLFIEIMGYIVSGIYRYCQIYRVTDEARVAETAVWPIPFLINALPTLKVKELIFTFYFLTY